jgi:hypothetical protein
MEEIYRETLAAHAERDTDLHNKTRQPNLKTKSKKKKKKKPHPKVLLNKPSVSINSDENDVRKCVSNMLFLFMFYFYS